jgi:hypothetical protein
MTPLQGSVRRPHPQSVQNFAFAQATLEALLLPNTREGEAPIGAAHNKCHEELSEDPLAPARGILNGLRLSVTLWGFVVLGVFLLMR